MNFGKAIKMLLDRTGLTQKDLANKTGISETSISKIMTDQTQPRKETINQIASSLGVSPQVLVMLSIDKADVPDERKPLYDSLWPFVEKAMVDIFATEQGEK